MEIILRHNFDKINVLDSYWDPSNFSRPDPDAGGTGLNSAGQFRWKRQLIALLLFGISFGYVEAAVVTYLRPQLFAARSAHSPESRELFPLLTLQQVKAAGPEMVKMTETEIIREAATLAMLGTVAAAAGDNFHQWLAFFLVEFGAWDIAFYAFLKILIAWPRSMVTWDILFLIPVPWTGPVLAPVIVSLTMIATGLVILRRESARASIGLRGIHWAGICSGAVLILAAFMWDYRNIMGGGMPNPFHWLLFAIGEALWLTGVAHALFAAPFHQAERLR